MPRYRPRHAKPPRPATRALPVLTLVGLCGNAWMSSSVPPTVRSAPAALLGPVRTFDAQPVVMPLAKSLGTGMRVPLPSPSVLLLPATTGRDLVTDPGPVPAAARADYEHASAVVAASGCTLPWQLLSAIGAVTSDSGRHTPDRLLDGAYGWVMTDTDQGRYDGSPRYDGPVGPLQLLPASFDKTKGTPSADPRSLRDAAVAAARYLCAVTTDLRSTRQAAPALTTYGGTAFAAVVERRVFSR